MIRAVAYCRVSTNKEEQLDSLEAQQQFFSDYAEKNGYCLIHIYADEGKSGTKMKNRTQLLRMLSDAMQQQYDLVLSRTSPVWPETPWIFSQVSGSSNPLVSRYSLSNYDQTTSESS